MVILSFRYIKKICIPFYGECYYKQPYLYVNLLLFSFLPYKILCITELVKYALLDSPFWTSEQQNIGSILRAQGQILQLRIDRQEFASPARLILLLSQYTSCCSCFVFGRYRDRFWYALFLLAFSSTKYKPVWCVEIGWKIWIRILPELACHKCVVEHSVMWTNIQHI